MNRVNTSTHSYLQKVVDTILVSSPLLGRFLPRAVKWKGEKITQPIKYKKNTQGGNFSGVGNFGNSVVDNRVNMEFEARFYEIPVVIPLTELSKNQADPNRLADLAGLELESATEDACDDIATQFYGKLTNSYDFMGLEAIVDDATNLATYGTLARSTYATLKSTVTASGGTLSLAKMSTLYNAVGFGTILPTVGFCSPAVFGYYEELLTPQERIAKEVDMMNGKMKMVGGSGFVGLYYKGFPIISDNKSTSGVLYFLNENYIEWRALPVVKTIPINYSLKDIEGNDYSEVKGFGFSWTNWRLADGQAAIKTDIYLGGEFWSKRPSSHGKLTGITGV